jgi:hypothetical protein
MRLFVEVVFWLEIFGLVIHFGRLLLADSVHKVTLAMGSILLTAPFAIWAAILLWA